MIALSLVFSVFASSALSYVMNVEPIVYALLVLWYFTLVTMGLFWIPNRRSTTSKGINCVFLGIPRLEAFRTLPPICGIIAAAAVISVCRTYCDVESGSVCVVVQSDTCTTLRVRMARLSFDSKSRQEQQEDTPSNLMGSNARESLSRIFLLKYRTTNFSDLEISSVLRLIVQVLGRGFFGPLFSTRCILDNGMRMQLQF